MATIGVLGASGFVGSTLVERLLADGDLEVRPFIHSAGNAWRLARLGLSLQPVDLLSKKDLNAAVDGCTHVVNCTRGSLEVMVKGLENLLTSCKRCNVQRFVHLSSVSVYQGPFPSNVVEEGFPGRAPKGTYGWKKQRQDRLVATASRRGLSSVVLCPPDISGPQSAFLVGLVQAMRNGRLAFVEDGEMPCNLVDVENLVHAIKLALFCPSADGHRIFVTDKQVVSWAQLAAALADIADSPGPPPRLKREEAMSLVERKDQLRPSILRALKHLVSSEVRTALTQDPLLASVEVGASMVARKLPARVQHLIRTIAKGKAFHANSQGRSLLDTPLIARQLRGVRYACNKAEHILGYKPVVGVTESQDAFRAWYRVHFGLETDSGDLFRYLN